MMNTYPPCVRHSVILATSLVLTAALTVPVWSADASRWDGDQRSAARLIAGNALSESGARILRAGMEIKLAPGWRTYWRYPGEAGVPPQFDFTGSENVKTITVLWPAPQRFSEEGITVIGYKGDVILPLRIVPQDERKEVTFRLKLDYGICERLCILAEAKVVVLSGTATSQEVALAVAEARVPKPVVLGEGQAFAIRAVRRVDGPTRPRIVVDILAPAAANIQLFAEGPTPDWALPLPEPVPGSPNGLRRFAFELDGLPAGARPEGTVLKLTAVSENEAIEVSIRLD